MDGAEVEWKTLGEVAKIQRGASPRPISQYITDDPNGIPWIKIGDTTADSKYIERTAQKITPEGAEKSRILKCGDFVMSNSMSYGRPYILKISGAIHDGWASISDFESILTPNFLYYYLSSNPVQDYWDGKINSSSVSNLNSDIIKSLPIPIPPLSVQTEIVKILDALTALTSELTSELILRRKQYEYYRETLLLPDNLEQLNTEGVKKKLSDVAYFQNGKGHEKNIDENGSFIVINSKFISTNGTVKKYCNEQIVPLFKDDILIVMSDLPNGKALAKTFFVKKDNKYTLNQRIGRITVKEDSELLPSFVNHFLNRNKQLTKYDNGTDQTNLRKDQILDVVIPIPPLKEQQRIVSILDKFKTLTNSITEGLPLAIEQSQKRYEYYQELLLNFS
ncbi:restriction endonuclease subunit S [Haemophilus haemolyticus]|uniref:restriction endonuclease subunit S n=1 Tax=Haemophilus haemolyticus TaxID=726 RepID=UPI00195A7E4A|nr:restriction endonuclease subunit S [Haemophilus haemolyticus]